MRLFCLHTISYVHGGVSLSLVKFRFFPVSRLMGVIKMGGTRTNVVEQPGNVNGFKINYHVTTLNLSQFYFYILFLYF